MNSQDIFESLRKKFDVYTVIPEKKCHTGAYSLLFSGTLFSLLGGSYLLKSGLFSKTRYFMAADAIRKVNEHSDEDDVPVLVYGKIHRIHGDQTKAMNGYAVLKSSTELRSRAFDESIGNWKDTLSTLDSHVEASSFEVVTTNGQLFIVDIPDTISANAISVLSYASSTLHEVVGDEKDEHFFTIERAHLSVTTPMEEILLKREAGIKLHQYVYVRGLLTKEGRTYHIHGGNDSKLTLSSKSIDEETRKYRSNGFVLSVLGISLIAVGVYRFQNYSLCCNK